MVALAAAPGALADPTWSGPQALPPPGGLSPVIAVDARDRALAAWTTTTPLGQHLATRGPGGPWTDAGRLAGRLHEVQFSSYAQTRILLVGREGRTAAHGGDRMMAALGDSTGRFGTFTQIDRGVGSSPFLSPASLSVNQRGAAVAAWTRERAGESEVRVTLRSAGRSFGSARSIGRGDPLEPAAGIDERGDVVVAWSRKHRIWARVRLAGHGWGPVHAIGTSIQRPGTISAAAGGRGRFLVSWQSATIADEEQGIPATITLKAAAVTSGRWHASLLELTRTFFDLGQVPATEVAFRAGSGLVAWEGVSAGSTAIKTATLGRDGSFSQSTLVSVPGRMAWFGDLAVGPTGGAVLAWLDPSGLPTALVPVASYASPGQPFGLPVGLMPGARGALGVGASISPVTGLPTVTWSAALANGTPAVYASTLQSP